jgi:spermidine synthase
VLIGGLGLGFSLKGVLAKVAPQTTVHVAELIPQVVQWNREFLAGLNGALLNDPRVKVFVEDVWTVIAHAGCDRYDALLLDLDNGPTAMVQKSNARLYNPVGIRLISAALKPGGRAAIWSASRDRAFADNLRAAGFQAQAVPAKLYNTARRSRYTIYIADKPIPPGKTVRKSKGALNHA